MQPKGVRTRRLDPSVRQVLPRAPRNADSRSPPALLETEARFPSRRRRDSTARRRQGDRRPAPCWVASAPERLLVTTNFADLGVPAALDAVLAANGITTPTPIQAATLPDSLAGKDLLGRGRTGSGKTYAFALPVVARLSAKGGGANRAAPRRP